MTSPERSSRRRSRANAPAPDGLEMEIELLRSLIQRVSAVRDDPQQVGQQLDLLDGVGKACCRLANLLRTEKVLGGSATAKLLNQALAELMEENPELFPPFPGQPALPGLLDDRR